jgi:hypothetical protein
MKIFQKGKKNFEIMILFLYFFLAIIQAQQYNVIYIESPTNVVVGVQSGYFTISFQDQVPQNFDLTLTVSSNSAGVTLSNKVFNFNSNDQDAIFQLTCTEAGASFVNFSISGTSSSDFANPFYLLNFYCNPRVISVYGNNNNLFSGVASYFQLVINDGYFSSSPLTISLTPTTAATCQFSSNSITIPANSGVSSPFSLSCSGCTNNPVLINGKISGTQGGWYSFAPDSLNCQNDVINVVIPNELLVGETSTELAAFITPNQFNSNSLTNVLASLYAYPNVSISSNIVQFNFKSPDGNVVFYNTETNVYPDVQTTSNCNFPNNNYVNYGDTLQGSNNADYSVSFLNNYCQVALVQQRSVMITSFPNCLYFGDSFSFSVSIPLPTPNSLTVTPYGNNINIQPNSFTFSGNTTSATFTLTLTGYQQISQSIFFSVTGSDVDLYQSIANPINFGLCQYSFFYMDTSPNLFLNTPSVPIRIGVSVPVSGSITLTPYSSSAYVEFNPQQLVFSSSDNFQSFNITPTFSFSGSVVVSWTISGSNSSLYSLPPTQTFFIYSRPIQVYLPQSNNLYVEESYSLTISVDQPPTTPINIIPSSDYFVSLEPPVITLSQNQPSQVLTITSKAISSSFLDFSVNGSEASYYYFSYSSSSNLINNDYYYQNSFNLPKFNLPQYLNFLERTITVSRVYSVQEKNLFCPGIPCGSQCPSPCNLDPGNSTLNNGDTFFNFQLTPPALNGLTITPHSTFLTFNPPQLQFSPSQFSKNIIFTGNVAGIHLVWFSVSGPDQNLYAAPSQMTVFIKSSVHNDPFISMATNIKIISISYLFILLFILY